MTTFKASKYRIYPNKQQTILFNNRMLCQKKVRAEMDLRMLGYNFKRVLNVLGSSAFKIHLKQRVTA
jgi:hypothetical protein